MSACLLPVASPARTREVARGLLAPHRRIVTLALGASVALTLTGLLVAPLLGRLVDLMTQRAPYSSAVAVVLVLAGIAVAGALLAVLRGELFGRVGERLLADVREAFVDRALRLPAGRLEGAGAGDLLNRATEDISSISVAIREALPQLLNTLLLSALSFVAIVVLDWRFVLAAVLVAPAQIAAARWYLRASSPVFGSAREAATHSENQIVETVGDAETVRALRLGEVHHQRVKAHIERRNTISYSLTRLIVGLYNRIMVLELIGVVTVVVVGFWLVRTGEASLGTASAAALYLLGLFRPLGTALMLLEPMQSATAGFARVVGVLDIPETVGARSADAPVGADSRGSADASDAPRITVQEVSHEYREGHRVLRDVSLRIEPGEHLALVGASGSGKSTLAKIIAGIELPTRGRALLDGRDVTRGPEREIMLVTQEVHVFAGSVLDDLRLVDAGLSREDAQAALSAVGAADWAHLLPDGIDTVVGSGAHRLSPVQAQQLALARVLAANPRVVILDEATATAGSAGSRVLDAAARTVLAGRTAIVVAHRLSQAVDADRIVVLDHGVIASEGSHSQLIERPGPYLDLWSAWSAVRGTGDSVAHEQDFKKIPQ